MYRVLVKEAKYDFFLYKAKILQNCATNMQSSIVGMYNGLTFANKIC